LSLSCIEILCGLALLYREFYFFNHAQAGKSLSPLLGGDVFSAFFNQRRNSMSLNHVVLLGNAGKAPEILKTSEKGVFARFSLATSKIYTAADGKLKKSVQWHTVYVRDSCGEAAVEYLQKGSAVCIRGELRNSEWIDSAGIKHFATAVYAQELIFLGSKSLKNAVAHSTLLEETKGRTMQA